MQLVISPQGYELIVAGAILFLLGLVQGVALPFVKNPRMALSAHTDGLQSGLALIASGVIWNLLDLSQIQFQIAFYSALIGYYGLWIGITSASITGASRALPMAGKGCSGSPAAEMLATLLTRTSGTLILVSAGFTVIGLL
jgi:hydroxylaminobenzene mutase